MSSLIRLFVCFCGALLACAAQETAAKATPARVVGEVASLDPAGQSLTVKSDAGPSVIVPFNSQTRYLRVPPGEQDLKKATKIGLQEIAVGDRVLALSKPAEGDKPGPATSIIVMTKSDIAQKQAAEHAEWQKRGIAGKVTALNPETKEITVNVPTRGNPTTLIVEAGNKVPFRRYAPDSVRFSDAKPSSFAELKVGDQVRILGEKNAENTRVKPEMIVFGTFHNIAGTVTSIDPAAGEIKITNLQTKKPLIVKTNAESTLKRLSPQAAMMLGRMQQAGAGGEGSGFRPGQGRTPDGAEPRGAAPGGAPGGRRGTGPDAPNGPGGFAGGRPGGGDIQQMLEHMPAFTLSELKPGDALIVASTAGADPSRVTAITLLAGVEPLLTAPRQAGASGGPSGSWNLDINIVP